MSLTSWEFVFRRRKWKLQNYLSDCVTVQDALDKFENGGMTSPSIDQLTTHGLKETGEVSVEKKADTPLKSTDAGQTPKRADKKPDKRRELNDEQKQDYDDIVIIETSE